MNEPRRIRRLVINGDMLMELITNHRSYIANLPFDTRVVGYNESMEYDGIILTIESQEFIPVEPGMSVRYHNIETKYIQPLVSTVKPPIGGRALVSIIEDLTDRIGRAKEALG